MVTISNVTRFHLYKENKDTHEALGVIGKLAGVQVVSMFYFIKVLHMFSVESLNFLVTSIDWLVVLISTAKIVWICRDKG